VLCFEEYFEFVNVFVLRTENKIFNKHGPQRKVSEKVLIQNFSYVTFGFTRTQHGKKLTIIQRNLHLRWNMWVPKVLLDAVLTKFSLAGS